MKEGFFGRSGHLELLAKRSKAFLDGYRQNIAIIGAETTGKTALIAHFTKQLSDNRLITVYLEAREESFASFTRRFIGILLFSFLSNSGRPIKEDLDFLINKSDGYIPHTCQRIRHILETPAKNRKSSLFGELLSLSESLRAESGKSCLIIFDEFHLLEKTWTKGLYKEWSKALLTQKNTMYIITSSQVSLARAILSKELALLFGNFELVPLEPFDIPAAGAFLEWQLAPLRINADTKNFLVHFTGGYPFYLQLMAQALQDSPEDDIAQAMERLFVGPSGVLGQRFHNFLRRISEINRYGESINILYLVTSGKNKLKEISHALRKPKDKLTGAINQLIEADALSRRADFLTVNDRLFGFWLKFIYRQRQQALIPDAAGERERFREYLENEIQEFILNSHKEVSERMRELMGLFEDDMAQLEKRKIRLTQFREIKTTEFGSLTASKGLIGRSSESLWIMAVKKGPLCEEDIAEFSRECRKYRHKNQKRIIVTLSEIDHNTRLKALEEKIWAWDIRHLNQMLDLYSKPWVVA
jgi:hypothetical protein